MINKADEMALKYTSIDSNRKVVNKMLNHVIEKRYNTNVLEGNYEVVSLHYLLLRLQFFNSKRNKR